MARVSVIPHILAVLEPYLEEAAQAYEAAGGRAPTLPTTLDGKVNVRRLVQALTARDPRVRPSHEQHFYRSPEIKAALAAVVEQQGIKPIGARLEESPDAARNRIGRLSAETSELRQALAEREALVELLRAEVRSLREQLQMIEETGMPLRDGSAS
jgi:hypothetical protein